MFIFKKFLIYCYVDLDFFVSNGIFFLFCFPFIPILCRDSTMPQHSAAMGNRGCAN